MQIFPPKPEPQPLEDPEAAKEADGDAAMPETAETDDTEASGGASAAEKKWALQVIQLVQLQSRWIIQGCACTCRSWMQKVKVCGCPPSKKLRRCLPIVATEMQEILYSGLCRSGPRKPPKRFCNGWKITALKMNSVGSWGFWGWCWGGWWWRDPNPSPTCWLLWRDTMTSWRSCSQKRENGWSNTPLEAHYLLSAYSKE